MKKVFVYLNVYKLFFTHNNIKIFQTMSQQQLICSQLTFYFHIQNKRTTSLAHDEFDSRLIVIMFSHKHQNLEEENRQFKKIPDG